MNDPQQHPAWHSRGYLPHFEGGEVFQFITFRLKDSLPRAVLEGWRRQLAREDEATLRRRVEAYLDEGYGGAHLKDPRAAALVQNALLHHDGDQYRLTAWVVMPNHVHLLALPRRGYSLSAIVHAIKSYTASEVNKLLGRRGAFWMEDYFDRYIRDADHYGKTVAYIEHNPVKARLCKTPADWLYGSARLRAAKIAVTDAGSAGIPARHERDSANKSCDEEQG
jgi:REP element-mobilizing transposase RayT